MNVSIPRGASKQPTTNNKQTVDLSKYRSDAPQLAPIDFNPKEWLSAITHAPRGAALGVGCGMVYRLVNHW